MRFNIQLFAHKKGQGSTTNGRDSESKRLGAKAADGGTRPAALPATGRHDGAARQGDEPHGRAADGYALPHAGGCCPLPFV